MWCAYRAVHRSQERFDGVRARGDHVEDLRGHAVLLPAARPVGGGSHRVNGFVKDVLQRLPMEFAVEAQNLIAISLEVSVG
jgi:hypothetical protein